MSDAEEVLAFQLRAYSLEVVREYRFCAEACGGPGRGLRARLLDAGLKDWRFDFAFLRQRLAVEVEGGAWSGGRHTRGKGFEEDLHKYGEGQRLGWTIYRCSPAMVKSGKAVRTILDLLKLRGEAA